MSLFDLQVQSYKFVPLVYQIASRMGSSKEQTSGSRNFQVRGYLLMSDVYCVEVIQEISCDGPRLEISTHTFLVA